MIKTVSREQLRSVRKRLERLYGTQAETLLERFVMMIGRYGVGIDVVPLESRWDEKDSVLITYGDTLCDPVHGTPLQALKAFAEQHFRGAIRSIHLLPFYPWSTDDGFSVINYRQVDPPCGSIDPHVVQVRQAGRKRHIQVVLDCPDRKARALPVEIMMVGNRRHLRLGHKLGDRNAERHVHRDRQDVLRDQNIDLIVLNESIQGALQIIRHFTDPRGHLRIAPRMPPNALVDPFIFRMPKISLRYAITTARISVVTAAIPITDMLIMPQYLRPFRALQ